MTFGWIDIACYVSESVGMVFTMLTIKSLDKPLRLFGIQMILGCLVDIGWGIPTAILGINNMWLFNVYLFFEFLLVNSAILIWVDNPKIKTTIRYAIYLMAAFTAFQLWKAPNQYNSIIVVVAYLFNSIILLYLIFEKFKSNVLKEILDPIDFILFIKIVFFMMQIPSLTLPREICSKHNVGIMTIINNINGIANVIHYTGTGICFLLIHRNKKKLFKNLQNV